MQGEKYMMSFIKGMAAGMAAAAVAGFIVMPKPRKYAVHMKRSADKAAKSIGELVDSVISVIG